MNPMKWRDVVKMVEKDGWYLVRTKGSHRTYHHAAKKGAVTLAFHSDNH